MKYGSPGYGCSVSDKIRVPDGYPRVPRKPPFLGEMSGSWYKIGLQFGVKTATLSRMILDYVFPKMLSRFGYTHLVEDLYRYEISIREWNPQYLDLIKGVATGASFELRKSVFANLLSDYEMVLFFQCMSPLEYRHPKPHDHFKVEVPKESPYWKNKSRQRSILPTAVQRYDMSEVGGPHDCTAVLLSAEATSSGKTMLAHNTQSGFGIGCYAVSYVARPPPPAHAFWTITIPGMLLNNKAFNDSGVALGLHAGGQRDSAFGVPWIFIFLEVLSKSSNLVEAVEIMTRGTKEYRKRSRMSSVLREGGLIWDIVDTKNICTVEVTAHYYGIRYPGSECFIVQSNHYLVDHSFNVRNVKTNVPMAERGGARDDGKPGSSTRYWAAYWITKGALGHIDLEWLQKDFLGNHSWFDKEGNRTDTRIDPLTGEKIPVCFDERASTICSHRGGYPESYYNEIPCPAVIIPSERKAYYIIYKPEFWEGAWETVTLSD